MLTQEILDEIGADGWEVHPMGDLLICPCGTYIELDGSCAKCGENPLRRAGLI